jgi:hypothetical protein
MAQPTESLAVGSKPNLEGAEELTFEEFHKLVVASGKKAELGGMLYRGRVIWRGDEPAPSAEEYRRRRLSIDREVDLEASDERLQKALQDLDNSQSTREERNQKLEQLLSKLDNLPDQKKPE